MAAAETTNPYPGPRPFTENDEGEGRRLYGRDREITSLFYRLSAERIVVLHSPSGAGKTSLLNAGLLPRLRKEGFDVERVEASSYRSLAADLAGRLPDPDTASGSGAVRVVLVFDQFEEILTLGLDAEARRMFFRQLGEVLQNPRVWALFAIRESYLGALDPYRDAVPTRLSNTFRIDLLTREAALDAIVKPAGDRDRTFEAGVAERLFSDLAEVSEQQSDGARGQVEGRYVEALPLQVVCQRLWVNLLPDVREIGEAHRDEFGKVDEALAAYYDDCVRAEFLTERLLREWFDERLITTGGIRDQVLHEQRKSGGLDNDSIDRLVEKYLVRTEQRAGATWYELAHDRLVDPVRNSNDAWFKKNLELLQRHAKLWADEDKPERLLLRGGDLKEAEDWAGKHGPWVLDIERDLLDRSVRQRNAARMKQLALGVSIAFLVIVSLVIGYLKHRADVEAAKATSVALAFTADNQLGSDLRASLLLSRQAYHRHHTAAAESSVFSALEEARSSGVHKILNADKGAVASVAFSPDGSTLAAGTLRDTLLLWNVRTNEWQSLPVSDNSVVSVAFSGDGSRLATGLQHGGVLVWDTGAKKKLRTLVDGQSPVRGLAFSPDGKTLAFARDDGTVWLSAFDVKAKPKRLTDDHGDGSSVRGVAFSPDGNTLAAGTEGGEVLLWNAHTRRQPQRLKGKHGHIRSVAFSPNGRYLAASTYDGTTLLWKLDTETRRPVTGGPRSLTSGKSKRVFSVAFSRDSRTLAASTLAGTVLLWNLPAGKRPQLLQTDQSQVYSVAFSPDGRSLAGGYNDGAIVLWKLPARTQPQLLRADNSAVNSVAFSPDGRTLAAGTDGARVLLWKGRHHTQQALNGAGAAVSTVAFSPDRSTLAAGTDDGAILLWNMPAGTQLPQRLQTRLGRVNSVAFSPDGKTLAAGTYTGTVLLWDTDGYKPMRQLSGDQGTVYSVAFSPDGNTLAAGTNEGAVLLWNLHPRAKPQRLEAGRTVLSVAFSPDGTTLAAGTDDGAILLWNLPAGTQLPQLLQTRLGQVYSVAFSPEGNTLAAGTYAGSVLLRDMTTGTQLGVLRGGIRNAVGGDPNQVHSVAFSPDGKTLAAGTEDGTVQLWNRVSSSGLEEQACSLVVNNLSKEDWDALAPGLKYVARVC